MGLDRRGGRASEAVPILQGRAMAGLRHRAGNLARGRIRSQGSEACVCKRDNASQVANVLAHSSIWLGVKS